jgi:hypothetical protein
VPLAVTVPRPFVGQEFYTLRDGEFQAGGSTFTAPANSVIETISVQVTLPAGQKTSVMMQLADDSGQVIGNVSVPLQFQRNNSSSLDVYVGTVTNAHVPMGSTPTAQQVHFLISRDGGTGIAGAVVTVIGLPGAQ